MNMKTEKGMYWHCHHDTLCEYVYDYDERVNYIKEQKPKHEVEIRLKLFKKIKGKLPRELDEARQKLDEAWQKWKEAEQKLDEAWQKYEKAWQKLEEARQKYMPELEKLHAKECGCKEWNGKKLIFLEEKEK